MLSINSKDSLISVLIPVYNVASFLPDTLQCLLNQTYQNFEVILVNDGSTDNSAQICEELAAKDLRFKLIHQHNQGFGAARNTGLKHATGEYVYFMDSDDLIEPTLFEDAVREHKIFAYDTVFFGFKKIYRQSNKEFEMIPPSLNCLDTSSAAKGILEMLFKGFGFGVWQQMFRRDFLMRSKVSFPTLKREADIAFLLELYKHLTSFKTVPRIYYLYQAFYARHKNNPDILKNHVVLYQLLDGLVGTNNKTVIASKIRSRYFVLWFCHVIPLHIYLNEKNSFKDKWKEFAALRDHPVLRNGLSAVDHFRFGSGFQALVVMVYKLRSVALIYFTTAVNYVLKYKLSLNYKKLYYRNLKLR